MDDSDIKQLMQEAEGCRDCPTRKRRKGEKTNGESDSRPMGGE